MDWNRVEDKLPEMGKQVLVTTKAGFANKPYYSRCIAVYYPQNNYWMDKNMEYEVNNVIAWQELPQVYVEPVFRNKKLLTDDNKVYYVETTENTKPNVPYYTVFSTITFKDGNVYVDTNYFVKEENALTEVERLSKLEYSPMHIIMYNPDMKIIHNINK